MNYTFTWITFAIYCLGMLGIGVVGMRKTRNIADYYVSGRNSGLFVQVPLFAASFISSASIISYTGFAYANGWCLLLMYGCGVAGGWIVLQMVSGRIYNANFEYNTSADLYCARYYSDKGFIRIFMGLFNMLIMMLYVVIGLTGIGTLLEVFLNVDYGVGVVITAVVFLIYTVIGGSFSVAWINVIQFALLFVGLLITAVSALSMVGGLSSLNAQLLQIPGSAEAFMHTMTSGGNVPWTKMLGVAIGIVFMCPVASYYHRIFFSSRSKKVAGSFIGVSALFLWITYICICIIGLSTRILLPQLQNVEQAFPTLVTMLPSLFSAVALLSIISAIQSTMDNQLLTAGSMISNDVYKKVLCPNATESSVMRVAQVSTLMVGVASTIIAVIRPSLVVDIYNLIMTLAPTVLFPPFILGLFWKRTTKEAAICGTIFGMVAGMFWVIFGPSSIPCTLVIMPINLILMVFVSICTPQPPQEVICAFFNCQKNNNESSYS